MISLDDESDLEEDSDSEDDVVENLGKMQETLRKMRQTWSSLSLDNPDSEVNGKWYGVIYLHGRNNCKKQFYIGKVVKRFPSEETVVGSPLGVVRIKCLKLKLDSGTYLEQTPPHLPDVNDFEQEDVIAGPLEVIAKKTPYFEVPEYDHLKVFFNNVKDINRKALLYSNVQ